MLEYDGSILLKVDGKDITISRKMAENIFVEKVTKVLV